MSFSTPDFDIKRLRSTDFRIKENLSRFDISNINFGIFEIFKRFRIQISEIFHFKTFSTQIINLYDYKRFIYRNKVVINENKYELRV